MKELLEELSSLETKLQRFNDMFNGEAKDYTINQAMEFNSDVSSLMEDISSWQDKVWLHMMDNQWFNRLKQGDLVIKRGKHEAVVYFVEYADTYENKLTGILLVNGRADLYFSNEDGNLGDFKDNYRLLAKAKDLQEE